MFKRHEINLMSDPSCSKSVSDIIEQDFQYYDKDGFELNSAEQKFYAEMKHPIHHNILNHHGWQQPWFELDDSVNKLILDHCMFLCRCRYIDKAEEQLKKIKEKFPQADLLLQTRQKWGFDFALDAVAPDGTLYEVLHIEFDSYNYDYFKNRMINFEWTVRHTDWVDAADKIWDQKAEWQNLQGFEQNHWKARFLLGWNKSEYTEKSI